MITQSTKFKKESNSIMIKIILPALLACCMISACESESPDKTDIHFSMVNSKNHIRAIPTIHSAFGLDDKNAELRIVIDSLDNPATEVELLKVTFEVSSFSGNSGTISMFNNFGHKIGEELIHSDGSYSLVLSKREKVENGDELYRIETSVEGNFTLIKLHYEYQLKGSTTTIGKPHNLRLGAYTDSN